MAIPNTCSALVQTDGKPVKATIPIPSPAENQVLVKVSHVAQNPTDVQSSDRNVFGDGAVLGCDFVGTVQELGASVSMLNKGDVIAGLVWGGEMKGVGGYSEYTIADERICFKVPDGLSPEKAATIPLAACTAWLALFSKDCLGIEASTSPGEAVLIWGGSSSVGIYAIQIAAAMFGLTVVTTCSPRHHDAARRLGAKHVFDYRDHDVVEKITRIAPRLKYVFDTIGSDTSSMTASQAISKDGGKLCTVRPGKAFTEKVSRQTTVKDVLVWTAFMKDVRYGDHVWPANEDDHKLSADFFAKLPKLISDQVIRPNNAVVFGNGLDGVADGFQEYRDGNISNFKIVYKL